MGATDESEASGLSAMSDFHLKHISGDAIGLQIDDRILVAGLDCLFRRPTAQFVAWQGAPESTPDVVDVIGAESVTIAVRYFLLRSEAHLTIIDTGASHHGRKLKPVRVGESIGRVLSYLDAEPGDVSRVVLTHLHMDHCGGVLDEVGSLRFPNAEHVIHRHELDHWTSDESPGGEVARSSIAVLVEAQQLTTVDGEGQDIHSGLRVVHTPGHTPGHMSVELVDERGQVEAMVSGDLLHHPMQLTTPGLGVKADISPANALQARLHLLHTAADSNTILATGHFFDEPFYRVLRGGAQTYLRRSLTGDAQR